MIDCVVLKNENKGDVMNELNKGYKITIFSNGKFCWKFERTKGIADSDKSAINVNWLLFILAGWFIADVIRYFYR